MQAIEFILKENVLTDNILRATPKGYVFKGGYIAIVKENIYQNPWSDKETVKKFRSKNSLFKYLSKHYPEALNEIDFTYTNLIN